MKLGHLTQIGYLSRQGYLPGKLWHWAPDRVNQNTLHLPVSCPCDSLCRIYISCNKRSKRQACLTIEVYVSLSVASSLWHTFRSCCWSNKIGAVQLCGVLTFLILDFAYFELSFSVCCSFCHHYFLYFQSIALPDGKYITPTKVRLSHM